MKDELIKVRVSKKDKEIIQNYANSTGQNMSSLLLHTAIDTCLNLEEYRQAETLNDFSKILVGRFSHLGKEKQTFTLDEIVETINMIQNTVLNERLPFFIRQQKRNSRMALDSYTHEIIRETLGNGIPQVENVIRAINENLYRTNSIDESEYIDNILERTLIQNE